MSDIERMKLEDQDVAYLVGRGGATRMRLEKFSGARLNIDKDCAEVEGTTEQRDLAKLAIAITLQQRNGGKVNVDFDDLEDRKDVSTFDVPKETVGFLLGAKGSTLRAMETKHRVFMFFNNDRMRQGKHGPCKRLYVIGTDPDRENALDEAEDVVRFKLTGESRGGGPDRGGGGPRDRDDRDRPPPRYDDRDDRRYDRGGPPPRNDDRRYEGRGPPARYDEDRPPRYEDRRDDRRNDDRAPPPRGHSSRYDEPPDRRPPPSRYDEDRPPRYEDRGPPPRDRPYRSSSRGRY